MLFRSRMPNSFALFDAPVQAVLIETAGTVRLFVGFSEVVMLISSLLVLRSFRYTLKIVSLGVPYHS